MANAYTSSTGNLAGTAGGAGLVQKAYDRLLDFALRSEPLIRSVADKKPTKLANPGSTVVLQLYADLSEQQLLTSSLSTLQVQLIQSHRLNFVVVLTSSMVAHVLTQ